MVHKVFFPWYSKEHKVWQPPHLTFYKHAPLWKGQPTFLYKLIYGCRCTSCGSFNWKYALKADNWKTEKGKHYCAVCRIKH